MPATTQGRSLHYRLARFHNHKGALQTAMSKALKALDSPQQRLEPLDTSGTSHRLINYATTHRGMLCGNMFIYTHGAAQLLMRARAVKGAGDEAASYPLETLKASAEREFLESILYFCVSGNHVLALQARGLRLRAFEQYLEWFLVKGGALTTEQGILLADQPKATVAEAIERAHVKAVSIGMPLIDVEPAVEDRQAKIKVSNPVIRALRELLGSDLDHMKLEDALDGNIQATIELKWSRRTTDRAQDVLDNLAVAMRGVEPDEVEIRLNDGTKVSGKDLKLIVPVTVTVRDNVIEQTSLFRSMRDTMKGLIESGAIEP